MSWGELLSAEPRLAAIEGRIRAAGDAGETWSTAWGRLAPEVARLVGPLAELDRLKPLECHGTVHAHLFICWLKATRGRLSRRLQSLLN